MGTVWVASLPQVLRDAGLEVDLYPGWETRSRSTGGYDELRAIQVHHTASNTTPANDMNYCWRNAPDRPIGALYLARDGRWTVGAAGATNTSGKGGPLTTSRGTIPLDSANRYVLSIEAANRGDGEVWPDAQLHSYVKGVAALTKAYLGLGYGEPGDIHSHFEWTTRKNDPAGQSWYATGRNKWDMRQFRRDVEIANTPSPPPSQEIDMIALDYKPGTPNWTRLITTGTHLSHVVGHFSIVLDNAGITAVTVDDAELDAAIASSTTTTPPPPEFSAIRKAEWNTRRGR